MFDLIKAQFAKSIPFAGTVGIEIINIGVGEATAALDQRPEVSNHIASLHAGALFTLGEAASGAAMSGAFASQLMTLRPIATGASIAYAKVAKGRIEAKATLLTGADGLLATLAADGRVTFDIDVTLTNDAGATVATMTVGWLVSKR